MQIMLDFLNSFKSLIKLEKIHTDNNVFKLHYRFTVITLIVFSILVTSKQYFGDPINCDVHDDRKNVIDTYCWIYGTFTVKATLTEHHLPGLGNYVDPKDRKSAWKEMMEEEGPDDLIISQKYYQWVCLVLCFQALLFYVPRYLWKAWEGGRLRLLVKDLGGPLISASWTKDNKERLISYMLAGKYGHNIYAIRFTFCEMLNFVNVVCQIVLMDWFLSKQFSGFGIALATFNGINPMTKVFPKLTKCTYWKFGPSGSLESRDALCVLPLNVVNEKLFIVLWFWFYLLTVLSGFALMYRALMLFVPRFRVYLLMAQARYMSRVNAHVIIKRLSFGDYFVLYQLGKNLNPLVYKDLVTGIGNTLMDKTSLSYNPEITIPI